MHSESGTKHQAENKGARRLQSDLERGLRDDAAERARAASGAAIAAEQALLGAILINNEAFDRVSTFLEPHHFYDPLHARIYDRAAQLIASGQPALPVSLTIYFENEPPIETPSGSFPVTHYLGRLVTHATSILNVESYAHTVCDLAARRELEVVVSALDFRGDMGAISAEIERAADIARTASAIHTLKITNAAQMLEKPAPRRRWCVEPWIPHREVTLISGDGGIGKSTIAVQLCASSAAALLWFGLEVCQGAALYISCEDDGDEIHWRLEQIAQQEPQARFDRLHIVSLAGQDAVMAAPIPGGDLVQPTPLFSQIERVVAERSIRLLVLDAAADVFGGNEVSRTQTRAFIRLLRGLAIKHDCAVVLLAHPSVDGMKTGRGYSGSTAWNNSVRSRLYFTRATASDDSEPDPDLRIMELAKSNRSRAGQRIMMRWQDGRFVLDGSGDLGAERLANELRCEKKFIALLTQFIEQKQPVSATLNQTYAPKLFAAHPDSGGHSRVMFERAMQRLLTADQIKIVEYGPPSRRRTTLQLREAA